MQKLTCPAQLPVSPLAGRHKRAPFLWKACGTGHDREVLYLWRRQRTFGSTLELIYIRRKERRRERERQGKGVSAAASSKTAANENSRSVATTVYAHRHTQNQRARKPFVPTFLTIIVAIAYPPTPGRSDNGPEVRTRTT